MGFAFDARLDGYALLVWSGMVFGSLFTHGLRVPVRGESPSQSLLSWEMDEMISSYVVGLVFYEDRI